MSRRALRGLLGLAVLLGGCGGGDAPVVVRPDLVGVWLRPIAGLPGSEGYQFEADGRVRFVNMFSIEGLQWGAARGDTIEVRSRTERYPRPETSRLVVVAVDRERLVLRRAVAGGPDEEYVRAPDPWQGRWSAANGDFVDITRDDRAWRVVVQRGGDFEVLAGREDGPRMLLGQDPGGRRLELRDGGCVELAGAGLFCRSL